MQSDLNAGLNEEQRAMLAEILDRCTCPPLEISLVPIKSPEVRAFITASDHDYYCRCEACKSWWRQVGPEENGTFGPFTREEIRGA